MVRELGAADRQLVEAVAALDRDRRVDVVDDLVVAGARADLRVGGGRETVGQLRHGQAGRRHDARAARRQHDLAVGVDLGHREALDHEQVVARAAVERDRRMVGVDRERVAVAALGDERRARAAAQPAAGRRDGREFELVVGQEVALRGVGAAAQAVDLADLEARVAGTAVERRDRAVVVDREVVVATDAVHVQAAGGAVVVDPLDREQAGGDEPERVVRRGLDERRVQQGHERRPRGVRIGRDRVAGVVPGALVELRARGGLVGDRRHAAQQEDVVCLVGQLGRGVDAALTVVDAVHVERLHARVRGARPEHVDHVVVRRALAAGRLDRRGVRARLAVDRHGVAGRDAAHRGQTVDDHGVVAVALGREDVGREAPWRRVSPHWTRGRACGRRGRRGRAGPCRRGCCRRSGSAARRSPPAA